MSSAFISDLHLSPARPHVTGLLEAFVDQCAGDLDALYVLGDLFDYWIGDDAVEELGHGDVLSILSRLSARGVALHVMRGNRDFLLGDDFARRIGCRLLPDPCIVELYGERVLLMHGDSLCTDDVDHQAFRSLVDSAEWRREFLARTVDERHCMARELRSLSEQGKRIKPAEIMDVNAGAVDRALRSHGVRRLIHGHTHRPAVHELDIGDGAAERIVLGDWDSSASVLRVSEAGYALDSPSKSDLLAGPQPGTG